MSKPLSALATILLLGAVLVEGAHAAALGSAFTYQGQLASGGMLVNGTADLRFRLYDAASGGNPVGSQLLKTGVSVSGGIFTVQLDFGVPAFSGDARWLEIDVRSPAGGGTYETLSPRQALTPAPYSLQTRGVYVDENNLVGIGTTTPAERLHVVSAGPTALRVENSGTATASVQWANPGQGYEWRLASGGKMTLVDNTAGDLPRLTLDTAGFVGIGTSAPVEDLHVLGSAGPAIRVENSGAGTAALQFANTGQQYEWRLTAGNRMTLRDLTAGDVARMAIDTAGNFAIGSNLPSPTHRLSVAGNVECDVLQINGGSDIAEPFEIASADQVVPGMIVSIDPDNPAGLRLATHAYDRTVAGVVSGAGGVNPGMMLRQEGTKADGAHPVALTGRVYCYVDADANGAVRPGDLLTTSDTPGHAMRVDDPQRASGAILGKAMTGLASGRGLVLLLVSLQ